MKKIKRIMISFGVVILTFIISIGIGFMAMNHPYILLLMLSITLGNIVYGVIDID